MPLPSETPPFLIVGITPFLTAANITSHLGRDHAFRDIGFGKFPGFSINREKVAELVEAIIAQAAARRAETGIEPLGAAAILRQQPFSQPAKTKRSPAPLVHAASKRVHTEMKIAYAWFSRAFREAAECLRAGDRLARFPRGSFPPGLPFVRAGQLATRPAT